MGVVDVAGRYEPERLSFNHRQSPADSEPRLRVDACVALAWRGGVWPRPLAMARGIGVARRSRSRRYGAPSTLGALAHDGLLWFLSPAGEWMSRTFVDGDVPHARRLGEHLIEALRHAEARFQALDARAGWGECAGAFVLDTGELRVAESRKPGAAVPLFWSRRSRLLHSAWS